MDEFVLDDEEVQGESPPVVEGEGLITEGVEEKKTEEPPAPQAPPAPPAQAPPRQDVNQQRIDEINRQMGELKAKLDAAERAKEQSQPRITRPEDHPLWPKEADWAADPTMAGRNQFTVLQMFENARRQQMEAKQAQEYHRQQEFHKQQQTRVHQVRQSQAKSFQAAVQLLPDLADEKSPVRKIADTLYRDPSTGLQNLPSGAFLAGAAADFIIRRLGEQKESGEQARVGAVKKGAMTASGKRGKTTGASLSKDEEDVISKLGVSRESYQKAKKEFGM